MLTQEIPRRNVIEGVHLKVLQDWMHVLRQYLPLAAPVRRLFYKLDEYVKPLHSLTADEWLEHVKEYQVCLYLNDFYLIVNTRVFRMNLVIHCLKVLLISRAKVLNRFCVDILADCGLLSMLLLLKRTSKTSTVSVFT
jgi:hypothetical protein